MSSLKPAQFSDKFNLETLVGKVCNIGDEVPNEYLRNPSDLMSITNADTVLVNPKEDQPLTLSLSSLISFRGTTSLMVGIKQRAGIVVL